MQEIEHKSAMVYQSDDDGIDLWALAQTLWKRRLFISSVTGVGIIASAIFAFSQPNIYSAKATIMPVDSSSDRLTSALSSLGALGGLASQVGVGLKGSVSDKFVAILKSRTLAESVIVKHNLAPILFPERWNPVRSQWQATASTWVGWEVPVDKPTTHDMLRKLRRNISVASDSRTGLIEITVDYFDPQSAADIANFYIIELNSFLRGNSLTSAKQNKAFLEEQLEKVTRELAAVEHDLKDFQEEHKLLSLDAQTQASVQSYATLKSQLMAKEMEINLLEKSTSQDDVQLIGLRQELAQIQKKLSSIENETTGGTISFKDAPRLGLQFAQLQRELLVRQKVFELITQQYELSKIEEAKETLTFQVIDKAIPADKKSKPNRLFLITLASFAVFVLSGAVAIIFDKIQVNRS